MTRPIYFLLAVSLCLDTTLKAQAQMGQSDWQMPGQSENQWQLQQQPRQQAQTVQSEWQTPYQNAQPTFYGNATTSQVTPQDQNGQYQPPGTYLNQQQPNYVANNQGKQKKHKQHDNNGNHESLGAGIEHAAGSLGRALTSTAPAAASVMSSYFMGKAIAKGGLYYPSPYYSRPYYPPMYGGYPPYGYGYGNGLSNFMHF